MRVLGARRARHAHPGAPGAPLPVRDHGELGRAGERLGEGDVHEHVVGRGAVQSHALVVLRALDGVAEDLVRGHDGLETLLRLGLGGLVAHLVDRHFSTSFLYTFLTSSAVTVLDTPRVA